MRRFVAGVVAAGLALGLGAAARAHVAPAVDVDNRYVKLTLLGDRVRLAYTVYVGELPGAVQRRAMDRDRDGALSGAEADAFGQALARQVGPALSVAIDGAPVPTTWAMVDVGLGTPSVRGGAFSVDLVAWYCAAAGGRHTVTLVDRYVLPRPGETEVRVEDGPGVRVEKASLGDVPLAGPDGLDARWEGPGGPLAADGLTVRYAASATAPRSNDERCRAPHARGARWLWPALAAAGIAVATGAGWLRRRRNGAPLSGR